MANDDYDNRKTDDQARKKILAAVIARELVLTQRTQHLAIEYLIEYDGGVWLLVVRGANEKRLHTLTMLREERLTEATAIESALLLILDGVNITVHAERMRQTVAPESDGQNGFKFAGQFECECPVCGALTRLDDGTTMTCCKHWIDHNQTREPSEPDGFWLEIDTPPEPARTDVRGRLLCTAEDALVSVLNDDGGSFGLDKCRDALVQIQKHKEQ